MRPIIALHWRAPIPTQQVFEAEGGKISIASGWCSTAGVDKGARWEPAEVGAAVDQLLAREVPAQQVYGS
jgi:hypothetical protein